VGRVPGTEHFRNIARHKVETLPGLLALRVDESLFFGNAAAVEEHIERLLAAQPDTRRLLLILSAVNHIDATALSVLEELEQSLDRRGMELALAEIKGPVMDRLARTEFGACIKDRVYLSTHQAFEALC
jgi:SulP family sulfate permease